MEDLDDIWGPPETNLDDLMNCDDFWEDKTFPRPRSPSNVSEDSRTTYTSWGSCTDSDISETIAPSDQNVDDVIRDVCYSFLYPDNLEEEEDDLGDKDEVQTTEIESSSKLSIRSEESTRPVTSTSSSSSITVITEEAKMLVAQVIDDAIKTLQSTETLMKLHSTDFASKAAKDKVPFSVTSADSCPLSMDNTANKALEGAVVTMKSFLTGQDNTVKRKIQTQNNKAEKLARRCNHKRNKSLWKKCSSIWRKKRIHPAPVEHLDESVESGSTDLKSGCTEESKHGTPCPGEMSTQLELVVEYVEDMTLKDTRNINQDHDDVEETKAKKNKGFFGFFRRIFSKVRIHLYGNCNE